MPRTRIRKPFHLEVTGLPPLPPTLDEWEFALIAPVLARLFAEAQPNVTANEVRDGAAN